MSFPICVAPLYRYIFNIPLVENLAWNVLFVKETFFIIAKIWKYILIVHSSMHGSMFTLTWFINIFSKFLYINS